MTNPNIAGVATATPEEAKAAPFSASAYKQPPRLFSFNPLSAHHALAAALPNIAGSYDLEEQKQSGDLFNPYAMGCMEGSLAYLVATNAANGVPAELVRHCRNAILVRLFGDSQGKGNLTQEQERIHAYIIGLMGDLEDAFTQPDSEVSE